eukprot:TRINITY_DN10179_c0_g1_i1.p1 TRINITY_DN10179_c0_g1~~TRINITY_DN10179_c0_g1_i1.p1  ORF type:complete len:297 (-),score=35.91 TRINITY_DN10179_c0_g1_i1:611-1501(-)
MTSCPDSVVFDQCGLVKFASLTVMIRKLLVPDRELRSILFLTYRSICTNSLDLMDSFRDVAKESIKNTEGIIELIIEWIELYKDDFKMSTQEGLTKKIDSWVEELVAQGNILESLLFKFKTKLVMATLSMKEEDRSPSTRDSADSDILESNRLILGGPQILEIDVEQFARQITLLDSSIWSKITHLELLFWVSKKKNRELLCENVIKMINSFDSLGGWVATVVCTTEKYKLRVKVMEYFINLAACLRRIGNLSGLLSVICGLHQGPVLRLKHSWKVCCFSFCGIRGYGYWTVVVVH